MPTEKRKVGRPTDEPKPHKVSAWISSESLKTLTEYCERKAIPQPQGIRDAIAHLKDEK